MARMLLAIAVVACSGGSETDPVTEEVTKDEATDAVAEEPSNEPKDGFAVATTYLRSHPTTERRIDDPDNPGKKLSTYIATLYRGNALTVVETKDEFVRVQLKDGSDNEGWLQSKRVTTKGSQVATIKEEVRTFSRPEMLSINTTMKLPAGAVLVVTQEQGKFVEVDYPRSQWSSASTWILAENLDTSPEDVEVAQLISKALYMREDSADKAKVIEDLAREQFAGNTLLTLLDPPEAEEAEAAEGAEPAAEGTLNPPPQ